MKNNNYISAEIIADSINKQGDRLTTYILHFPRIVLAEFNTHRMLSKNSASSRAIPFEKMLQKIMETPFIPIKWMKNHSGMQGNEYFTDETDIEWLTNNHLAARDYAIERAKAASDKGLSKQIINRYLEPFLYHTVIVTGSEWENFFALRAHPAAEIHIADLAEKMLVAYNESTPKLLKAGEWHIPFGDKLDLERLKSTAEGLVSMNTPSEKDIVKMKAMIATARCARVSYLNFEGKDDYLADVKLHDNLFSMGHFSPFEHLGRCMTDEEYYSSFRGVLGTHNKEDIGWSGNLKGFVQYRKLLIGENKKDDRVIKKG